MSWKLKGDDRLVYIRARDAVEPFGVPLDLAALEYAEAKKLLQGGGLVEAARFFHRHASKVTHKLTPDVVDELIRSKQAQGLSDVHIKDLKSRLTRFSDCFRCQIAAITPAQIHDFLTSLKLRGRSVNNYRIAISNLFSFALLSRGDILKVSGCDGTGVIAARFLISTGSASGEIKYNECEEPERNLGVFELDPVTGAAGRVSISRTAWVPGTRHPCAHLGQIAQAARQPSAKCPKILCGL